jgi:hypothetical protein
MQRNGRWLLVAVLSQAALLLACGSARPTAPLPAPDSTSCAEVAGTFLFEDLARSCRVKGSLVGLPLYPVESAGRLRGPRERKDFLPLPLAHWGDPGSAVRIGQSGCSRIELSLFSREDGAPPTRYLQYELDLVDLACHGTLILSESRLSFESAAEWEDWQLPIGISRLREGWSMARDEQGRLVYSYSRREASAILWVIPAWRRLEVTCVLPRVQQH